MESHSNEERSNFYRRALKWGAAIIFMACLVYAVDVFFLGFLFPLKKLAMIKEWNQNVTRVLEEHPANSHVENPGVVKAETLQSPSVAQAAEAPSFQEQVKKCFPQMTAATPEEFFKNIQQKYPQKHVERELENFHLKLPNGEERRLHLIYEGEGSKKSRVELRFFKLDAEGLPDPIQIPDSHRLNPSAKVLSDYMNMGEVKFHQLKENISFGDRFKANVEIQDGKYHEFRIYGNDRSFMCRENACECRVE